MIISDIKMMDCIEGMKQYPDKFFDLAIVDPPYGLGKKIHDGGTWAEKYKRSPLQGGRPFPKSNGHLWDVAPTKEYFDELFRVSKNQIIWGANHFELPRTECFVTWDKLDKEDSLTFAMVEYAWTSFDTRPKVFRRARGLDNGFMRKSSDGVKFHPTQKPIQLYEWLLKNYAKKGNKILDTHLGSQSSRIAAYKMGFDFWAFEIDEDYFKQGNERFKKAIAMPLFDLPTPSVKELTLL